MKIRPMTAELPAQCEPRPGPLPFLLPRIGVCTTVSEKDVLGVREDFSVCIIQIWESDVL